MLVTIFLFHNFSYKILVTKCSLQNFSYKILFAKFQLLNFSYKILVTIFLLQHFSYTHPLTHSLTPFDTLKVTFSQTPPTDRRTNGPTTRLLELLRAAKNAQRRICPFWVNPPLLYWYKLSHKIVLVTKKFQSTKFFQ